MKYNSPKPQAILDEDKVVSRWDLRLTGDRVTIVPAEWFFE